MISTVKYKKEINEQNISDVFDSFEENIISSSEKTKVVSSKKFFSLPLNNILSIVSKIDLVEQDPISYISSKRKRNSSSFVFIQSK